jgi:hypothetical protein
VASDFLSYFLQKRGITPNGEVARARGYAPYAAGDVEAVYAAMERHMPGLMENEGGRRNPKWVEKFTRSEGFVIPKYPVFRHLYPIRPQLRPTDPVVEREWRHNHSDNAVDAEGRRMSPAALADHRNATSRKDEHEGVGLKRRHTHVDTAKYGIAPEVRDIPPRKDGTGGFSFAAYLGLAYFDDSKRLDRNPLSDFSLPGPVYFGIEGTPKDDAMVEWLRRNGRPAKVINVPSVSTWRAPELALFALRHMRGYPVVIVPDADWIDNDEVIYHAENCALYLRHRCGVEAVIAAPPLDAGHKGVDDFLGDEGSLDNLDVIRRDFDAAALADFDDEYRAIHRARRRAGKTLEPTLRLARLLGRTSGSRGTTLRNVDALATLLPAVGLITEEEALMISKGYEVPGDREYTEAQRHETLRGLDRLAGVAYDYTGEFPEWVDAHWETVGRKKDGTPRRVLKKGAPGSRIEFLRVDERLMMHRQGKPEKLGAYLGSRAQTVA